MTDAATVTATATLAAPAAAALALTPIKLGFVILGSLIVGSLIGSFVHSERVNKVIKDILTGKDGRTYEFIKVIGLPILAAAVHLTYISVIFSPTHAFDIQSFGIGMGSLLFGIGAGVGMKKSTEPEN